MSREGELARVALGFAEVREAVNRLGDALVAIAPNYSDKSSDWARQDREIRMTLEDAIESAFLEVADDLDPIAERVAGVIE